MTDSRIPAPAALIRSGIVGAVEMPPYISDGAGVFSQGFARRTALLFGPQLMQRLAERRAQANSEASHV